MKDVYNISILILCILGIFQGRSTKACGSSVYF
jgi:hypothetical protein